MVRFVRREPARRVAGFGDSIADAMKHFDANWTASLAKEQSNAR
jgi:hypothetical protein